MLLEIGPQAIVGVQEEIVLANELVTEAISTAVTPVCDRSKYCDELTLHYRMTTTIATVLQHLVTTGSIGTWQQDDGKERKMFDPDKDLFIFQDALNSVKLTYVYFFRTLQNHYRWSGYVSIQTEEKK